MKSPFPGMDPYLETFWGDIHTRLIVYASNQLNSQLPDDLQARVEESLSVEEGEERLRTVYADVSVQEEMDVPSTGGALATNVATAAKPYLVPLLDERRTQRNLEIVDAGDGGRVVTAIEFLSPANKLSADGRSSYVRKQREYIEAGVNLVEIDLVRAGGYLLAAPEGRLPVACRTLYRACVRRAKRPGYAEVYPLPLREELPDLSIPLRPLDQDVLLKLQPLLDQCYRDGRYHRINYRLGPTPRLSAADASWVEQVLKEKGMRPSEETL